MSTRPYSLNDIEIPITKIRRDQHKRINAIVKDNSKFPIIALGLVRDYVKNSSAHQVVHKITFDREFQLGKTTEPKTIIVWTTHTVYEFSLKRSILIETPTL